VEGNVSAVKSVTDGANGTVTINDNGTVTYTPEANFNGTDSFTYTNAEGTTATVNVSVSAIDDLTSLSLTTVAVTEDTTAAGDVIASFNATDVDDTVSVDFTEESNDAGYYAISGSTIILTEAGERYLDAGNALPEISLTTSGSSTDVIATATPTTTLVNDAPELSVEGLVISEETLVFDDASDSVTKSGSFKVSDSDSETLTFSLEAPTSILTSNGNTISWSTAENGDLVGNANGQEVIRVTLDEVSNGEGTYTVTLSEALDQDGDTSSIDFSLVVNDGETTTTESFTVTVDDSTPTSVTTTASLQLGATAELAISNIASGFSNTSFSHSNSQSGISETENTDSDTYDELLSWGYTSSRFNSYVSGESSIEANETATSSPINLGENIVVASITHVNDSFTSTVNNVAVSDNLRTTNFNVDATLLIAGEEVTVALTSILSIDETNNAQSNSDDSLTLINSNSIVEVNGVEYTVYLDGFLVDGEVVRTVSTAEEDEQTYSIVAHVEVTGEDNTNSLTGLLSIDAGADGLDAVVSNTTTDENGTLVINEDGTYTFTPSTALVETLNDIESTTVEYNYIVVDGDGDRIDNSLVITVNADPDTIETITVESVVLVSNTDDASGVEGIEYTVTGDLGETLNDSDGFTDANDTITAGDDVEDADIETYGGDDTLTAIDDIKGSTVIDLGEGDDTIIVGDDIREKAEIDTGAGNDTITVGDSFTSRNSIETDDGDDSVTIGGAVSGEIHMGSGNDYLSIGGALSDTVDGGSSGTDYLHLVSYSYDDYIQDTDSIRSEYIEDFEYIMFEDGTVYDVEQDTITDDKAVHNVFEEGTAIIPASDYYTVSGMATGGYITEGDVVTLAVNGVTYTTDVALDGTWTVDISESDLNADSTFEAVVSSSDDNGNMVDTATSYTYLSDSNGADTVQTAFEETVSTFQDNMDWFESNTGIEDSTTDNVDQNTKYWNDDDLGSNIIGTGNNDTIYGNGGDDHIVGSNSQDYLIGGDGQDWLEGGDGDDKLYGESEDDLLTAGTGQDKLFGGEGNDILIAGAGDDSLSGDEGNDLLIGGSGHDSLYGGDGDDIIIGGLGNDALYGGSDTNSDQGSDTFVWLADDTGTDVVYGFSDNDHLDLSNLLQNETSDNLSDYFEFDYDASDNSSIIKVYAEGDKNDDGAVTQTIILDDYRLEGIDSVGNIDQSEVMSDLYNSDDGSSSALIISDNSAVDPVSNSVFDDDLN